MLRTGWEEKNISHIHQGMMPEKQLPACFDAKGEQTGYLLALAAFVLIGIVQSGIISSRWKAIRSIAIVIAIAHVALVCILHVTENYYLSMSGLPPCGSAVPSDGGSQWYPALCALTLLQILGLPEVHDLMARSEKGFGCEDQSHNDFPGCSVSSIAVRRDLSSQSDYPPIEQDEKCSDVVNPTSISSKKDKSRTLHILVIDDDVFHHKVLQFFFREHHAVHFVSEAEQGLTILRELEGTEEFPDIILMDFDLPGMDGVAATTVIKRQWKDLPVLFCTSFVDSQTMTRSVSAGADHFIEKPLSRRKIKDCMSRYFPGVHVVQ